MASETAAPAVLTEADAIEGLTETRERTLEEISQ